MCNPIDIQKIVEWFIGLGVQGIVLVITGVIVGYFLRCHRIKQLKEVTKELRDEVQHLTNARNDLRQEVAELRKELEKLEDESEELRNEVERLEERVKRLTKKNRLLKEYIPINISKKPHQAVSPPIQLEPEIEEKLAVLQTRQLYPVTSKGEIAANLSVFDGYCNEKSTDNHSFADEKMIFGRNFVAMQKNGQWVFAPSKFAGYACNSRESYEANIDNLDGRESDRAIKKALGVSCETDNKLNEAFQNYCQSKNIAVRDKQGKFWKI